MSCSDFHLLIDHCKILQQNALKVINPTQCSNIEALQLETISLLSSVVDCLKTQKVINEDVMKKINTLQQISTTSHAATRSTLAEPNVTPIVGQKDLLSTKASEAVPLPKEFTDSEDPMGEITPFYSSLKQWCGKNEARVVFEGKNLTAQSFWKLTHKSNNIMIIIQTEDDYMFGSYHSVIPESQEVWVKDDPNHFVFTLVNPNHVKPSRFDPLPRNGNLLFVYGDNDPDNVAWVNYCYWITTDNVVYLWHHFPENYVDNTGFGGDLFVGCVDWDNPNEIKKVFVLEWID